MIVNNSGKQKSLRSGAGFLTIPSGQSEQPDTPEIKRVIVSNPDLLEVADESEAPPVIEKVAPVSKPIPEPTPEPAKEEKVEEEITISPAPEQKKKKRKNRENRN